MVAQWLSSRVKVKRVGILGPGQEVREFKVLRVFRGLYLYTVGCLIPY